MLISCNANKKHDVTILSNFKLGNTTVYFPTDGASSSAESMDDNNNKINENTDDFRDNQSSTSSPPSSIDGDEDNGPKHAPGSTICDGGLASVEQRHGPPTLLVTNPENCTMIVESTNDEFDSHSFDNYNTSKTTTRVKFTTGNQVVTLSTDSSENFDSSSDQVSASSEHVESSSGQVSASSEQVNASSEVGFDVRASMDSDVDHSNR